MSTIMDYLVWRGDLSFEASPFNEVDNLILSQLAYMDFSGIVAGEGISLAQAAERFFGEERDKTLEHTALFHASELGPLLEAAAKTERFGKAWLFCEEQRRDLTRETQFGAVSFDLGKPGIYLAFSGTDDSLVGWKEDFNMSFMEAIPAQLMACDYLRRVARECPGRTLMLGGHSKGGNLAVYAALHAEPMLAMSITRIYNNDGPGFREGQLQGPAFEAIRDRVHTIVPQSSVIGMMLEHDEEYRVVRSSQKGILQHDAFSWEVERNSFVELSGNAIDLEMNEKTLKKTIGSMSRQDLERFTDAIFEIISTGGVQTTTELMDEGLLRSLTAMRKTYAMLPSETRRLVHETLTMLLSERLEARLNLWIKEAQGTSWMRYIESTWRSISQTVEKALGEKEPDQSDETENDE